MSARGCKSLVPGWCKSWRWLCHLSYVIEASHLISRPVIIKKLRAGKLSANVINWDYLSSPHLSTHQVKFTNHVTDRDSSSYIKKFHWIKKFLAPGSCKVYQLNLSVRTWWCIFPPPCSLWWGDTLHTDLLLSRITDNIMETQHFLPGMIF